MSSAALLLLIPLAWLAVTLLVVAACRVTAHAEAEGQRPPGGGAGGLRAASSTISCVTHPERRPLELGPRREPQLPAGLALGGRPKAAHVARFRRRPTGPVRVASR
jgi:hypothetical protein